MSDYRSFFNSKRWKSNKFYCIIVSHAKPLSKWLYRYVKNGQHSIHAYDIKFRILCSSDHPILFKFCQLVVKIVNKELHRVFRTSIVINSNGNMKEKVDIPIGYFMLPLQMLTLEVWNSICNSLISVYANGLQNLNIIG